jgi:hypothetical protein
MVASPKGLGPEKDCAGKASNICKRQARPLVREGAPQKQDRNCQALKKISGHEPQMGLDTKTYWLTDRQSQCDFDFDLIQAVSSQFSDSPWSEWTEEYPAVYLRLFKSFKWQRREVRRVKTYCANQRLYLECVIQTMCNEVYDRVKNWRVMILSCLTML